jgi:hypothetical protein
MQYSSLCVEDISVIRLLTSWHEQGQAYASSRPVIAAVCLTIRRSHANDFLCCRTTCGYAAMVIPRATHANSTKFEKRFEHDILRGIQLNYGDVASYHGRKA